MKKHVAHIRVVWLFCVCLCVCVICVTATNNSEDNDNDNNNDDTHSNTHTNTNKCQLYLAPTTVGGQKNGNYGIFTAVDLRQGETVLANDGPNIPVLLMDDNDEDEDSDNDAEDSTDTTIQSSVLFPQTDHLGLFMNVWWGINSPASDLLSYEIESDDDNMHVYDLQITFGALPNCHPYRSNLGTLYPRDGIDYNDRSYLTSMSILQSSSTTSQVPDESIRLPHQQNPLRGSFSYYTGRHFFIDIDSDTDTDTDTDSDVVVVPAGTELFLDYAEDWLQHGFPRKQDYYSAATLLRKWMLTLHHPTTTTTTTTNRNNTTCTTTTTTNRNNNNTSTKQRTTTTRTKQKQEKSPFWKAAVARINRWTRQSLLQLNTHRKRNKRNKNSRDQTTRGRKDKSESEKEKKECTVAATNTTTALLASATDFLDHLRFLQQLLHVQTSTENDNADTEDESASANGIFHIEELTTRIVSIVVASAPTPAQLQRIHDLAWERHHLHQNQKNRTSHNNRTTSIPSVLEVAEAMYLISLPVPKTTVELAHTGICLDHLVAGPSSTPLEVQHDQGGDTDDINNTQASSSHYYTLGRGAIANRFLPKGTLIVPVPFLHLLDRSLFERKRTQKRSKSRGATTTNDVTGGQPSHNNNNKINSKELLLNYCYGHFQSTLLLCPVTNAVLINHCSDRGGQFPCTTATTTTTTTSRNSSDGDGDGDVDDECDSDSDSDKNHHPNKKKQRTGPNAYYRWASESEWDPKTKRTLTMTLQEIAALDYQQQHRMLSMEIVASRDIQPGEEVFIDYGEKWEAAWLEHVQHWSSSNRRAEHNDDDDTTTNKNNNNNSSSSWWRGWSSSVTEFELNHHWYLLLNNDDNDNDNDNNTNNNTNTNHDRSLFYGDLRAEQPAVSKDGRFMALCWYQDLFSREEGGDFGTWGSNKHDSSGEEGKKNQHRDESWNKLSDEEIVEEYAINVDRRTQTKTQTTKEKKRSFRHFEYDNAPGYYGHFWPCSIISKVFKDDEQQQSSSLENDDEDEYDYEYSDDDDDEDDEEEEELFVVRIYPSQVHFRKYGKADYEEDAIHVLLTHYPRSSIKFVTLPYQSDQHHPQAFRHHIEIKNDMFPEQWKNKKK